MKLISITRPIPRFKLPVIVVPFQRLYLVAQWLIYALAVLILIASWVARSAAIVWLSIAELAVLVALDFAYDGLITRSLMDRAKALDELDALRDEDREDAE